MAEALFFVSGKTNPDLLVREVRSHEIINPFVP